MKYIMKKTQQFGSYHFKKGEQVFVSSIKGTSDVILSRRKHQPNGPTVSREWLRDLVVAQRTEPQEVIERMTANGNVAHTFRHVGSVDMGGSRAKVYIMDHLAEQRYYVDCGNGRMRGLRNTEFSSFKSREED